MKSYAENNEEDFNELIIYALKIYSISKNDILAQVFYANEQIFNYNFNKNFYLIHIEIYSETHFHDNVFENNLIYSEMLIKEIKLKLNLLKGEFKIENDRSSGYIDVKNNNQSEIIINDKFNASAENSDCESNNIFITVVKTNKNFEEMMTEIVETEEKCRNESQRTNKNGTTINRLQNYYIFCDKALDKISHQNLLNCLKTLENPKISNHTDFYYNIIFYSENFKYCENKIFKPLKTIDQPLDYLCVSIHYYSIFIICQDQIFLFKKDTCPDYEKGFQKLIIN
ncbi:hypothetical protein GVAV_001233 [Gurleya vavrai]